ncbi:MAG: thioredoxin family protein [Actinobacteria bacterium]|nr:thioredoxin family protein [Actinomycetota bacterium]
MEITLQYWAECPNWPTALERVHEAVRLLGIDEPSVVLERIETEELAQRRRFRGSPTILLDGRDPFAGEDAPFGLSCRLYRGPDGSLAGAPSVEQIRDALARSSA